MLSISREAMRTYWYPSGQMRYVTPDEWKHNKYTDEMISSRERSFGIEKEDVEVEEDDFYDPLAEDMARMEASRHTVEVEQLTVSFWTYVLPHLLPEWNKKKGGGIKARTSKLD